MYGNVELETVSEVHFRRLLATTIDPNISSPMDEEDHFCRLILYKEIADSRVRIWDVVILIPNLIFLIFIAARFNRARLKLRATSSPIFLAFYGLVVSNILISVIRCVVSMTVNAAATVGGLADKVLWVTVRFFLLSTEMSVVIFGLAFGHLDSRSSIRRVLLATSFIALAFTITQGTLELVLPDDTFEIPSKNFYLFGHGGMLFWFCSSLVFSTIYLFILILPWTRLRERLALPTKRSFYIYAGTLALLNLTQSIGAGLLNYTQDRAGLCVVDITAALYLTLFTPLVYHTFLSEFFGVSQPSIMFSYKAQVDDAMDEDTVSLPHQQSFSSLKTDSDYIYQVHTPSIHMPLHDSSSLKAPSTSKQRSSVYSLAHGQVLASNWSRRSSSHVSLPVSSTSRVIDKRQNVFKTRQGWAKKSPSKFQRLEYSPLSTPNLNIDNPAWNFNSDSKKAEDMLSPTASNFIYTPESRDSNVNLFTPPLDDGFGSLRRKAKSSGEITADVSDLSIVKNARQGAGMFDNESPHSSEFLDQDGVLNLRLSINSGISRSEIVDGSLHQLKNSLNYVRIQKQNLKLFTNYIDSLSESNQLFNEDKNRNSDIFNPPLTSTDEILADDGERTNSAEFRSSRDSLVSEYLSHDSKLLSQMKPSTSALTITGNGDNFATFSPKKQSSFKDPNNSSQLLRPRNSKHESEASFKDGGTSAKPNSLSPSQSQSTDLSFFSAKQTLDNSSNSDGRISTSSLGNSQSTTFYSFSNSDNNSRESSGLGDYLKLFTMPPNRRE